jgi:oligopeptide/dipeptide ABC transporter ATP-binding protein
MFEIVGLQPERVTDYPHEFSGGMQQRVIIALALFLRPSLIIADEPTTALDVIMQDQIFKYLDRVKEDTKTAMMLISHDISLMFETCDRMALLHSGQVAESGDIYKIHDEPKHPYTILLKRSFPDIRHPNRELETIDGHPPQNMGEVNYCTFQNRCPWATEECNQVSPRLEGTDGHKAACIRKEEVRREMKVNTPEGEQ